MPSSRGPLSLPPRTVVALLAGAAAVALAAIGLTACSAPPAHPQAAAASDAAYGTLPSYLPRSSLTPDGVLTGTAARPALTVEGDAVDVDLGHAQKVRATVTGPVVPGEGLPFQPEATTATFQVTLEAAGASIPLALEQFHAVDHLGAIYQLAPIPGQPGPPATVEPGQMVTFELRVVMVTGEGVLQWAPDQQHPVASWDFVVEND
jgi:hypothetical protein